MTWRKHFTEVPNAASVEQWLNTNSNQNGAIKANETSPLYEVYTGPSNRIERYNQYDIMDSDSVISAALDTISEFATQKEDKSKEYFEFDFKDDASEAEVEVLHSKLREWTEINDFDKRLRDIIRHALKYGDAFFVRDPETYRWMWIDPYNVERVIVDDANGKKPEQYWVKNPDLNLMNMEFTKSSNMSGSQSFPAGYLAKQPKTSGHGLTTSAAPSDNTSIPIPAEHIVHLSLSSGLDVNWPFGNSHLEKVYKSYKQKELIEDAILIYRVHRAPERRVFYVDVGNMPAHRVMSYLERVKNEINQRRIPTKGANNQNILDSTFNPMSMTEDFYFPQNADGRGSRVDTLPGGENLGSINDLDYFDNKLKQGLQIPSSYLSGASTDDSATYNDGRATTALIAEYRFQKLCERVQSWVNDDFDREFKLYLKSEDVQIDASLFQLTLNVPQNFARYRQIELDNSRISTWSSIADTPYISKRFALERWLGLTEDEIVKNEIMWKEENSSKTEGEGGMTGSSDDLGTLGIRPELGGGDLEPEDFDLGMDDEGESPISGGENDVGGDIEPPPPA